jgi:hypothetical protein
VPGLRPADAKDAWGIESVDDREQGSGRKKVIGKRYAATEDAAQLGRVGPHVVSLGACFQTPASSSRQLRSQGYTGSVGAENFPYFVTHPAKNG